MASVHNFESKADSQGRHCESLWRAVLSQALSDAFGESRRPIAEAERGRARAFCLAESGKWQKEREQVCALAGVDPDAFREKVEALYEGITKPKVSDYHNRLSTARHRRASGAEGLRRCQTAQRSRRVKAKQQWPEATALMPPRVMR